MKKTKKKKIVLRIITPPTASTNIETDLVKLTEYLVKKKKVGRVGGILGGEFGYGCDYKNDVFEMRPYYWDECDCGWDEFYNEYDFKEKHKNDCYQSLVEKELIKKGWENDKYDWLNFPNKMSWEEKTKIEDKIRKKYCKKFNLSFPGGCIVHCTCDRDKNWVDWYKEKIIEFRGKSSRLDEDGLPEAHKDTCSLILPNFKHYKSGLEIRWYKWIGRDMKYSKKVSNDKWKKIFKEVINSLKK